jgi:hypothetical protein
MMDELKGPYKIVNDTQMRERANKTDDPRHIFYTAGLTSRTYEEYLERVGHIKVDPPTHPSRAVTGRVEIKWWRDQGWIRDA